MKHSILILSLLATLGLAACDRPAVVTVPTPVAVPTPVPVPGPPGPQGDPGPSGAKGAPGGDSGTTVIVVPPASAPGY